MAGRRSPSSVLGVALAAKVIAAKAAATTGAIASHGLLTPSTVNSVCSRWPSSMKSAHSPEPWSPISGKLIAAAPMKTNEGIASASVIAGRRR